MRTTFAARLRTAFGCMLTIAGVGVLQGVHAGPASAAPGQFLRLTAVTCPSAATVARNATDGLNGAGRPGTGVPTANLGGPTVPDVSSAELPVGCLRLPNYAFDVTESGVTRRLFTEATGELGSVYTPLSADVTVVPFLYDMPFAAFRCDTENAGGDATETVHLATSGGQNPLDCIVYLVGIGDGRLSKTGPATAAPGEQVTYTITMENLGPGMLFGLEIRDPNGALGAPIAVTGAPVPCSQFPCQVTTAPAGAKKVFTATYVVPAGLCGATVTNTATLTSPNDANPSNNTASAQTLITGGTCPVPTTIATTAPPTTAPPTTVAPTTAPPTTAAPTTAAPTTAVPSTAAPVTTVPVAPTTVAGAPPGIVITNSPALPTNPPPTAAPTTAAPTTAAPTTAAPTTAAPVSTAAPVPTTTPPTSVPASVAGVQVVRNEDIAVTGSGSQDTLVVGIGMVLAGLAMLIVNRARPRFRSTR